MFLHFIAKIGDEIVKPVHRGKDFTTSHPQYWQWNYE